MQTVDAEKLIILHIHTGKLKLHIVDDWKTKVVRSIDDYIDNTSSSIRSWKSYGK